MIKIVTIEIEGKTACCDGDVLRDIDVVENGYRLLDDAIEFVKTSISNLRDNDGYNVRQMPSETLDGYVSKFDMNGQIIYKFFHILKIQLL